jgi:hypothetical protein
LELPFPSREKTIPCPFLPYSIVKEHAPEGDAKQRLDDAINASR